MSMGYSAIYFDTVAEEFVKKICSEEFDNLMEEIEKRAMGLDEFAIYVAPDIIISTKQTDEADVTAYIELCLAFKEKTGLSLEIMHHNGEVDGDRYDDISGIIWVVGDVYQYTLAGEKYRNQIERKGFVAFG